MSVKVIKMEIGISIFGGIPFEKQIEYFKRGGINKTFISSETENFDEVMKLFNENGIICETLHAPFDKINDMWGDDEEAAENMLNRLKDSVDKCKKYNIPVSIVHLSSGKPMPEINEKGLKRYEELFLYAKENGVAIALENQRFLENLEYFMNNYDTPRFCWDSGHEYGFTKNIKFLDYFGDRLTALHIHDNRCGIDTDDHLVPYDGMIDFDIVASDLAKSGYKGTLMLELGRNVIIDGKNIYENMSDEEFINHAQKAARKLADKIEKITMENYIK